MGVYKDMWGYGVLNVWGSVLRFSAEGFWLGLRVSGLMAWGLGCLGFSARGLGLGTKTPQLALKGVSAGSQLCTNAPYGVLGRSGSHQNRGIWSMHRA